MTCQHGMPMDRLCLNCLDAVWNQCVSFNPPRLIRFGQVSDWEQWCVKFGIDPNTPDEHLLDDYLHGRTPSRPQRRVVHHSLTARHEIAELERWLRL